MPPTRPSSNRPGAKPGAPSAAKPVAGRPGARPAPKKGNPWLVPMVIGGVVCVAVVAILVVVLVGGKKKPPPPQQTAPPAPRRASGPRMFEDVKPEAPPKQP